LFLEEGIRARKKKPGVHARECRGQCEAARRDLYFRRRVSQEQRETTNGLFPKGWGVKSTWDSGRARKEKSGPVDKAGYERRSSGAGTGLCLERRRLLHID